MFKKLSCMVSVALLIIGNAYAAKGLSTVCKSTRSVGSVGLYKNSAPLRSSTSGLIIGFRTEPTLLFSRRADIPSRRSVIYSKSGSKIGSCLITSAHGFAGRARCVMKTSSLRRAAIKNAKAPNVYFSLKKGCVKIEDAGRCYGSVKGLCNRTIS